MDQDIEILALTFESPFYGPERALRAAAQIGVPIEVRDVTDTILRIVEAPPHGHGKNLNPCIDCHAMMLREAGLRMDETGADFLFTGEVLGQRPFSQNYRSLQIVAGTSGYGDRIVRPLSARLLPETRPEAEGKVDRDRLLDIQGRSRSRQMALAASYGINEYERPAGGCLLTDPGYSARLRDLLNHDRRLTATSVGLLKLGRHFRLGERTKVIVGRKEAENDALEYSRKPEDTRLEVVSHPGPVVLIVGPHDDADVGRAASLTVRYSDAPKGEEVEVRVDRAGETWTRTAVAAENDLLESLRI